MVQAAAKNHPSVAIVTSPAAYGQVVDALGAGGFTLDQRKRLAAAAFVHTASYDSAVASWLKYGGAQIDGFPTWTGGDFTQAATLRYGENPHQRAALYRNGTAGVASAEQLHGRRCPTTTTSTRKPRCGRRTTGDRPTVAIVKHVNPCGIAVGETIEEAYARAHATDPVSAFGGSSRPTGR